MQNVVVLNPRETGMQIYQKSLMSADFYFCFLIVKYDIITII
jgi:hypothetical protein